MNATGGVVDTGGSGAAENGGFPAAGGSGDSGTGGVSTSTGGNVARGGAGSGAKTGSGGSKSSGGKPGAGGTTSSGGSTSAGGVPGSGGSTSSGGKPSMGGSTSTGGAAGSGGSGGVTSSDCAVPFTVSADDNYRVESTLTTTVTNVQPSSELFFDWSGVTTDLRGEPVRAEDVGMVEIGLWNLTLAQFETKLNEDALAQNDLVFLATILPSTPTTTTGNTTDLTEVGQRLDESTLASFFDIAKYPPANHLYTAMVASGTELGVGTRMLQAFQLAANSTNTQVAISSDSTELSLNVDLHSLHSPAVPPNAARIVVDWSRLDSTAEGQPFDPRAITEVRIGKYTQSPAELEQRDNFLNLDTIADELYSATVDAGTSFDLSLTHDSGGKPFAGIDASGTWLLALNCGDCTNPAPWYMTVLTACSPGQTDCLPFASDACTNGYCGDGIVNPDEACDEGAANDGRYGGCNPDCTLAPYCGDGIVQGNDGEECDDPADPGDGLCNQATCQLKRTPNN